MSQVRTVQNRTVSAGKDYYSRAEDEWARGRTRSAFRLFRAAAENREPLAYQYLASFYNRGVGTKPDRDSALYWYRRAHRYGSSFAANNIGAIYRDRKDFNRALAWFRRAVEIKDANANLNIAKIYLKHKKDNDKAIYYLNELLKADSEDCTESAKEEARLLLARIGPKRKPRAARPRRVATVSGKILS